MTFCLLLIKHSRFSCADLVQRLEASNLTSMSDICPKERHLSCPDNAKIADIKPGNEASPSSGGSQVHIKSHFTISCFKLRRQSGTNSDGRDDQRYNSKLTCIIFFCFSYTHTNCLIERVYLTNHLRKTAIDRHLHRSKSILLHISIHPSSGHRNLNLLTLNLTLMNNTINLSIHLR